MRRRLIGLLMAVWLAVVLAGCSGWSGHEADESNHGYWLVACVQMCADSVDVLACEAACRRDYGYGR